MDKSSGDDLLIKKNRKQSSSSRVGLKELVICGEEKSLELDLRI